MAEKTYEENLAEMSFKVSAVHGVNAFLWGKLQSHLGWKASDYGGMRPFTTPQQQPEFNDMGKPYIVYNYRTGTVGGLYGFKEDYVVYQINSVDEEDIREAINVMDLYLGANDISAELINNFTSQTGGEPYRLFDYKSLLPRGGSGAAPSDQEGGITNGTYEVAIRYTSERVLGFIPGA